MRGRTAKSRRIAENPEERTAARGCGAGEKPAQVWSRSTGPQWYASHTLEVQADLVVTARHLSRVWLGGEGCGR